MEGPVEGCPVSRVLKSGHRETAEMLAVDGVHWISITVDPIFNDKGEVTEAVHIVRDITEEVRLKSGYREAEAKYRDLYDNGPDMFLSVDAADGKILQCNQTFLKAAGYAPNEIIGSPVFEIYHPESREKAKLVLKKFRETGFVRNAELKIIRKNNTPLSVSLTATMVRDQDGRPLYSRSSLRDISQLKQAEEVVRQQAAMLADMSRIGKIGAWEFDASTGNGTWSEEAARIHGLFPQIQTSLEMELSFFDQASREKLRQAFDEAIRQAHPFELELELRSSDGRNKWVRIIGQSVSRDDKVIGVKGAIQDFTERKQAQETILRERRQLATIYQTVNDVIFHLAVEPDGQFRFLTANQAFSKTTGIPADQIIGRLVSDVIPEPSLSLVLGKYRQAIRQKKIINWEETTDYLSGTKTGEVQVAPVFDEKGNCTHLVGTVHDITRIKHSTEALRRTATRLEIQLELEQAILALNPPETVANIVVNRFNRLISYDRASVSTVNLETRVVRVLALYYDGKIYTNLISRFSLDDFVDLDRFKNGHTVNRGHLEWVKKPGVFEQALLSEGMKSYILVPLLTQEALIGMFLVIRNSPEKFLKDEIEIMQSTANQLAIGLQQAQLYKQTQEHAVKLEQRFKERTKALESFTYSVSHDLRAPLRAIVGFSNILVADHQSQLDEEGQRLLKVVTRNAEAMGRLIDDLLSLSRIGRQIFSPVSINMNDMVKEIITSFWKETEGRKITWEIADLPWAVGDRTLLRQVWINLIANALKFTRKKKTPRIAIGSRIDEDELVYYIEDNGVGFDETYVDKLFQVFQRLHSTEEFEGTGVGLAIVKQVIQRHHGHVWATGELNRGATFYFTLPVQGDINEGFESG